MNEVAVAIRNDRNNRNIDSSDLLAVSDDSSDTELYNLYGRIFTKLAIINISAESHILSVGHKAGNTVSVETIARRIFSEESAKLDPQPIAHAMNLWDLGIPGYKLKHFPIAISVEEWPENEFIAHWHDVEAIGYGETRQEAIRLLKEDVVSLYEDLKNSSDGKLGKNPAYWKRLLSSVIEEKSK